VDLPEGIFILVICTVVRVNWLQLNKLRRDNSWKRKTLQIIVGFFIGYFVNRGWEFSNRFISDIMLLAGIN
ncbi:MAG: hypothetical protein B7Y69_11960, partial [Sphingobacteriia bacterium 35-40-8]